MHVHMPAKRVLCASFTENMLREHARLANAYAENIRSLLSAMQCVPSTCTCTYPLREPHAH